MKKSTIFKLLNIIRYLLIIVLTILIVFERIKEN